MVEQYHELLTLKGYDVAPLRTVPAYGFRMTHYGKRFQLVFVETYAAEGPILDQADETVILTLDTSGEKPPSDCTLIDLLAKKLIGLGGGLFVDTCREFLRKRGIRCQPGLWRYQKGLI